MTDETLTSDGQQAPRPTGGGLAAVLAPEGVAAILAVIVVVVLLASRLSVGGGVAIATPSPTPTPVPTATPVPGVDTAAIDQLLTVNRFIEGQAEVIALELKTPPVDPGVIQGAFQQITPQINLIGLGAASRLASSPGGAELGTKTEAIYQSLLDQMNSANGLRMDNVKGWTASTTEIAKTLVLLPDLDTQLRTLRNSSLPSRSAEASTAASPNVLPSASVAASPSVLPSPTAVPTPTQIPITPPPASVEPSVRPSGSPGASPALGPNLLQDGGFETGVGPPWELVRADPAAAAAVSLDISDPTHKPSAKIEIQAPSNRAIGLAYQQAGFPIQAGGWYRVSIALRALDLREVRIRIADAATGQLLGSRIFQVGTTWTPETFDFTSLIGSDFAVYSIDVGQSGETVWVDDAAIARIPPV